jgi:uncharacterized membrane protein
MEETGRLEAFSDGVMAVIITIMALELRAPVAADFHSLSQDLPELLVYVLSFTYIGIYWNNHHHLLRATRRVDGAVMWTNLHLLFWLSLVPVMTEWMAKFYRSHLPASIYGVVVLGAALAYTLLVRAIIRCEGKESDVAQAIGSDTKGNLSILSYVLGIALAWVSPWISYALFAGVAVMWFVPDRRLSRRVGPA